MGANIVVNKPWAVHVQEEKEKNKFITIILISFIIVIFFIVFAGGLWSGIGLFLINHFYFTPKQANNIAILLTLVIIVGSILLWFNRKNLLKKKEHNNKSFTRNFFLYWITFTCGYWIATKIVPYVNTFNIFVQFVVIGFILEISSKILQLFLYNKSYIRVDKWFIVWGLIHSFSVGIVLNIIEPFNIQNYLISLGIIGLSVNLITHLIWKIWYK